MSLTSRGVVSAGAAGSASVIIGLLQAARLVVYARLIAPADVGLYAMAAVVTTYAAIFVDAGLGNAVIHRDDVSHKSLSGLFWLNVMVGAAVFVLTCAATPLVAGIYGEPRLIRVIPPIAIGFLIAPLGLMHQTLAEKRLEFGRLSAIEIGATGIGVLAGIIAAIAHQGVYAYVIDYLTATAARAGLLVAIGWRRWHPSFVFDREALRGYVSFGAYSVGQRSVNFVSSNADFAMVGALLGAQALGYYRMAYDLANLIPARLNAVIGRVFFPVLTQLRHAPTRLQAAYFRLQETAVTLGSPLVIGLGLTAPIAVPVLLGERWRASVDLLQVLSVVGLGRLIAGTVGPLILAKGRPDLGFRWSLLIAGLQVPAMYLAARSGSTLTVALTFASLQCCYLVLNYLMLIRSLLGPCLPAYVRSVAPALARCAIMAVGVASVFAFRGLLPPPALLTIQVAFGALLYIGLTWIMRSDLLLVVAEVRRQGGPSAS